MAKNKYFAKKTTVGGMKYDSKGEANRHQELKIMERVGDITQLQHQVKFEIIPKIGKQRAANYIADFVYYDKNGVKIVEDFKGMSTAEYKLKKKLMLFRHGISITETGRR